MSCGSKARAWGWSQAAELGLNGNYAYYACVGNSRRNQLQHHEQTQTK
jgi:hypothetical protein